MQQQFNAQEQQDTFTKKWANLEPVLTAILCNDKHGVSSTLWMQSYTFATTLIVTTHHTVLFLTNTPCFVTTEMCMTW